MIKRGDLVAVLDQLGNQAGPYLYVDGPIVPSQNPGMYDYSSIVHQDMNLWHYVVTRGEKMLFILSAWGTLMEWNEID